MGLYLLRAWSAASLLMVVSPLGCSSESPGAGAGPSAGASDAGTPTGGGGAGAGTGGAGGGTTEEDGGVTTTLRYGPDGTAWASLSPDWDAPATTVVASWPEILAALGQAAAGTVIHLSGGDYGIQQAGGPALVSHLADLDTNVLVRSVPGEVVRLDGLATSLPNVTWAGLELGGFNVNQNGNRTRLARSKLGAEAGIYLTAVDDVEIVEVVALERGHNKDRVHISPDYNGGVQDGRHIPRNLLIERCWLEGLDVDTDGPHSDTIQWLGMAGEVVIRRTFLGAAGNNSTLQAGAEWQGQEPYATFLLDTVFLGGAIIMGNGNTFGQGSGATYLDCEWDRNLKVRTDDPPVTAMNDCRIEPADPKYPNGQSVSQAYPDNDYGVSIDVPEFVPPPWWW